MSDPKDKRIKFCRYCDGVIEWGTEICPHCGETLKVVEFDDMDFIGTPGSIRAAAPPPPTVAPIPVDDDEDDEDDDVPDTVEFESLDLTPADAAPVLKPVDPPPVMTPITPPPVMKPVTPGRKGRPAPRAPVRGKKQAPPARSRQPAPVLKPLSDDPPIVKPLSDDPPIVRPLGAGDREAPKLPPMEDCPVCNEPGVIGGACRSCGVKACVPCLISANGLRVSSSPEMNRVRWGDRSRKLGPNKVRCPDCGEKGVDPA